MFLPSKIRIIIRKKDIFVFCNNNYKLLLISSNFTIWKINFKNYLTGFIKFYKIWLQFLYHLKKMFAISITSGLLYSSINKFFSTQQYLYSSFFNHFLVVCERIFIGFWLPLRFIYSFKCVISLYKLDFTYWLA